MGKFDQILSFVAIVETHSFAKAAKKMGISTAAISKHLHLLEKQLEVELLHRTTRRVDLSESGKLYYEHCKRVIYELEEAEKAISTSRAEPSGNLSVVSGRYFAQHYIIPFLQKFTQTYPQVCLNLELAERIPDLYQEKIDLIIGYSIPGPASAIQRTIAKTRYALCASPSYLQKHGIPQRPSDLPEHIFITHAMLKPDHILAFNDNSKIHLNPFLKLNDSNALAQCAINGLGMIQVHHYIVAEALGNGSLVEVLRDYQAQQIPLYLYYQESRHLQPKIRHFIDFVLKNVPEGQKNGCAPLI